MVQLKFCKEYAFVFCSLGKPGRRLQPRRPPWPCAGKDRRTTDLMNGRWKPEMRTVTMPGDEEEKNRRPLAFFRSSRKWGRSKIFSISVREGVFNSSDNRKQWITVQSTEKPCQRPPFLRKSLFWLSQCKCRLNSLFLATCTASFHLKCNTHVHCIILHKSPENVQCKHRIEITFRDYITCLEPNQWTCT